MHRLRLVSTAAAIAALSLGVVACGDDEDDGGGGTGEDVSDASFDLKVGVLVPLTGDLSAFGPAGEKAAELAVQEVDAALKEAGADGITIDSEVADTQTEPGAAQSAANQLISGDANCLVGPWSSSEVVPVGRSVAAREQIPLISPSATSPEITELPDDGFVFRTAPSDALQGQVLADTMEEQLGGTDAVVSVAARNDPYGEGIAETFTAAWEEKGGTVTDGSPVLYDVELSSYNSEAEEIVADSPDAYVIIDFEEPYNELGAALARTGDFDATTMYTADGLAFEDGIPDSIAPDSIYGAKGTRPATPESDLGEEFNSLYEEAPGEKERNTFDAQNFDAVTLCALAAVASGSNEGADIAEQIQAIGSAPGEQYDFTTMADAIEALQAGEDIDFEGISGNLELDDNGDPAVGTYDVYEYDDKGAFSVTDQVEQESGD